MDVPGRHGPYLTVQAAARFVGVSERKLREARDWGDLRVAVLSPRTHRIAIDDLRLWVAQYQRPAAAAATEDAS